MLEIRISPETPAEFEAVAQLMQKLAGMNAELGLADARREHELRTADRPACFDRRGRGRCGRHRLDRPVAAERRAGSGL